MPSIHFYDALHIGIPATGQLLAFDSLMCREGTESRYSVNLQLRPDVAFDPVALEDSEGFNLPLDEGVSEYEWSRHAQALFAQADTLHIGVGNTSLVDNFIRYSLYRCLSQLPNTEIQPRSYFLDLLTVSRAISILRPSSTQTMFAPHWSEARRRQAIFQHRATDGRADAVADFAKDLSAANPRLMAHAISYSSPRKIMTLAGMPEGHVEQLDSLKPLFVCHESIMAKEHFGIYLAMGTDPQYENMIYGIDLQADLSDLLRDGGQDISRFIRERPDQIDRPVVRINLNRVPFVCPVTVINPTTAIRLGLDMRIVLSRATALMKMPDLCLALMEVSGVSLANMNADPDYQLYGAEYLNHDLSLLGDLHSRQYCDWDALIHKAHDTRITALGRRLVQRWAPDVMSSVDAEAWRRHCAARLQARIDPKRLPELQGYCTLIAATDAAPKGLRAAAKHWLNTIWMENEPS